MQLLYIVWLQPCYKLVYINTICVYNYLIIVQDESLILMVVLLLIPAIIISVVNVLLYCSVADSQKSLRRASAAVLTTHADLQLAKTLIVMVTSFILAVIPMIVMCILGVIWDDVYITYPESYNPAKANMYNSFTLLRFVLIQSGCNVKIV